MPLPILPTTVVGSYSMPGWLERLKTEYFARRISRQDLDEIHDAVVKAAIKDQEVAGLDVLTDGELRRDNMIDYFVERMAGVQFDRSSKKFYYDFYDSEVIAKLPLAPLGLSDDFRFLRDNTALATKVCLTGPHSLSKRIRNKHYSAEEAFALDIARVLNLELKELVKAGARLIQIDEPYISGFPEETWDDVRQSMDVFMHSARCPRSHPQLNLLAPLAETPLLTKHKNDLILEELCSCVSHQGLCQDSADVELIVAYPEIFPNFYMIPTPHLDQLASDD